MRIGHEERERAARELAEHFSAGRLDPDEYDERVAQAYAARTTADLEKLFADLPRLQEPEPEPPAQQADTTAVAHSPQLDVPAPYGREPTTGIPYSDRSKVVAAVLQLVLPVGAGRFYSGHHVIGLLQLLLAFVGIGIIWSWIDALVLLAGRPTDPFGRPLRS